ncbi:cupin domain-containing protein [Oricola cellulosilytica]|uniref:DUF4437 domain-containing protein n=1 Tax=Oricola cellulosilytica TaxID=1429082 RepID=A0A4R0P8J4_9HYPH|nr:cupin domain-containing protein [Oricola cellulosilytica]TCD10969.1 DUF4437 domain-containing protein [Oricola cellulosilytica]
MKIRAFLTTASLALFAAFPSSVSASDALMLSPGDLNWSTGPKTLPGGAEVTVLSGNPGKEGPFVLRLRFPEGYAIPAHRHSKVEHVTVLEGDFNYGLGDVLDRGASIELVTGSFVKIPAETAHFAWTENGAVIQLHADGPFGITYLDPKDDPRSASASN